MIGITTIYTASTPRAIWWPWYAKLTRCYTCHFIKTSKPFCMIFTHYAVIQFLLCHIKIRNVTILQKLLLLVINAVVKYSTSALYDLFVKRWVCWRIKDVPSIISIDIWIQSLRFLYNFQLIHIVFQVCWLQNFVFLLLQVFRYPTTKFSISVYFVILLLLMVSIFVCVLGRKYFHGIWLHWLLLELWHVLRKLNGLMCPWKWMRLKVWCQAVTIIYWFFVQVWIVILTGN